MGLLDIFANFFIDTQERFLRMQDSFHSFKKVYSERWIINVRGRFADITIDFLKKELGPKLIGYRLNSSEGWFHDTRKLLSEIKSDYVLFWLEDHVNIGGAELLNSVVKEMRDHDLDSLVYSFWQFGKFRDRYRGIEMSQGIYLDYFIHDVVNNEIVQNSGGSYLIATCSVLKKDLFKKIILTDDPIPRRWPKETPFDFEKAPRDIHWLPLRVGVLKQELFASIDDDHGCNGYALQSRGLYPIRQQRQSYAVELNSKWRIRGKKLINKLREFKSQFKFFCILVRSSQLRHTKVWLQSLRKNFLLFAPCPWITFDSLEYLRSNIRQGTRVFEYGSGGSSLFWSKLGASVITIEHDLQYYATVNRLSTNYDRIELHLIHPEPDTENKTSPADPYKYHSADPTFEGYSFKKYCTQIDHFPDNFFDMVFIDGRARPSCIMHSVGKVKPGGLLVLDDSDRSYYLQKSGRFLDGFAHLVFKGVKPSLNYFSETTVFKKKI